MEDAVFLEKHAIFAEKVDDVLEKRGFHVEKVVHLEPYDKAHAMIVAQIQ